MSDQIYSARYSSVDVFELVHPTGSIMKRKNDNWVNATHILKAANFAKARRTRILEKDVITNEHEKIQGGFGKYQGTWVPLNLAMDLATKYNVFDELRPLFDYVQIPGTEGPPPAPKHHHSTKNALNKKKKAASAGTGTRTTTTTTTTKPISNFSISSTKLNNNSNSATPSTESLTSMDTGLATGSSQIASRVDSSSLLPMMKATNNNSILSNFNSFSMASSPNATITAPPSALTSSMISGPVLATTSASMTSTGKRRGRPPLRKNENLKKPVTIQRSKSDFDASQHTGDLNPQSLLRPQQVQLPPLMSKNNGTYTSKQQQQQHLPLIPSTNQTGSFSVPNTSIPLATQMGSGMISRPNSRMSSFNMMSLLESTQSNSAMRPSLTSTKLMNYSGNNNNNNNRGSLNIHARSMKGYGLMDLDGGIPSYIEPLTPGKLVSFPRNNSFDEEAQRHGFFKSNGEKPEASNYNENAFQLNNVYLNDIASHLIYSTPMPDFLKKPNKNITYDIINMPIDNEGNTVFHWACAMGNMEVVKNLFNNCDVNIYLANQAGENGLLKAVMFHNFYTNSTEGEKDCFMSFLQMLGNELLTSRNNNGENIFHYIVKRKSDSPSALFYLENLLQFLNANDANKNKLKLLINQQDYKNGDTPLHIASFNHDEVFYKMLLSKGCDVNVKNFKNTLPLFSSGILAPPPTSESPLIENSHSSNQDTDFFQKTPEDDNNDNDSQMASSSTTTTTVNDTKNSSMNERRKPPSCKTIQHIFDKVIPDVNSELNKLSQVYHKDFKERLQKNNELEKIVSSMERKIELLNSKLQEEDREDGIYKEGDDEGENGNCTIQCNEDGTQDDKDLLKPAGIDTKLSRMTKMCVKTQEIFQSKKITLEKNLEKYASVEFHSKQKSFDSTTRERNHVVPSGKETIKERLNNAVLLSLQQLKRKNRNNKIIKLYDNNPQKDKFFKYRKMISKGTNIKIGEVDTCLDGILKTLGGTS